MMTWGGSDRDILGEADRRRWRVSTEGWELAAACRADALAVTALSDWCEERGIQMLEVGKAYLIRTVTHYYTGRVVECSPIRIVLENSAWVAETGRFSDALKTGKLSEVEPYPNQVIVSPFAVVDACEWAHELPRRRIP
jgi:hypothetical protein